MENEYGKRKRLRSPSYPVIDLREAIEKAKILWKHEGTHPIPKEVVFKHLGYTAGGGYGGRVISALKQFDLIQEKQGDIILTQYAIDLAIHNDSDKEYKDIVMEIALKPDIYNKIYNEYNGQLPSDDSLRIRLIKNYLFNIDKIPKFINDLRNTIDFAGVSGQSVEQFEEKEEKSTMQYIERELPSRSSSNIKQNEIKYTIPIKDGQMCFLTLPRQLCKDEIPLIKEWFDYLAKTLPEHSERTSIKSKEAQNGEE